MKIITIFVFVSEYYITEKLIKNKRVSFTDPKVTSQQITFN